jgi:hypothetical protein
MGRFDDELTRTQAEAIQAYLIDQAWQMQSPAALPVANEKPAGTP